MAIRMHSKAGRELLRYLLSVLLIGLALGAFILWLGEPRALQLLSRMQRGQLEAPGYFPFAGPVALLSVLVVLGFVAMEAWMRHRAQTQQPPPQAPESDWETVGSDRERKS